MQQAKQIKDEIFADVIRKIQQLSISQQKFIQEMLFRHESPVAISKKKILKKSYGIWAGRKDIAGSIEYVDSIRQGWDSRLKRLK